MPDYMYEGYINEQTYARPHTPIPEGVRFREALWEHFEQDGQEDFEGFTDEGLAVEEDEFEEYEYEEDEYEEDEEVILSMTAQDYEVFRNMRRNEHVFIRVTSDARGTITWKKLDNDYQHLSLNPNQPTTDAKLACEVCGCVKEEEEENKESRSLQVMKLIMTMILTLMLEHLTEDVMSFMQGNGLEELEVNLILYEVYDFVFSGAGLSIFMMVVSSQTYSHRRPLHPKPSNMARRKNKKVMAKKRRKPIAQFKRNPQPKPKPKAPEAAIEIVCLGSESRRGLVEMLSEAPTSVLAMLTEWIEDLIRLIPSTAF
ncbi:hypothetical protein AJ79_04890 [Helicocarpus griseus UAMH5409]|uniref:Uncharacterized protein n=1 Tax=Helicocarpus griseus UAMH5409 TaxID=1447875 RepID=A0A2B7XR12_9EURO|nr:hypothetical protein AJ79_04890 [Helicocarpus griseus UAMH5409]